MNIEQLIELFKWMSIINIVILMFSTLAVITLKSLMVKMHSQMFGVSETDISKVSYVYLGIYKALIIIFNIGPYFALLVINF